MFRSFPSGGAAASDGTDSVFDALGRFLEAGENVSPYASTSYAYLSGNRVQVTNPRGNSTTTTYFALGSPDQSLPILIAQPENVTTAIVRNDFGEMTSATQSGGSASATRTYRYDSQHRLCRQVDPETGSTVYAYDGNGQVDWYALAASGGTGACNPVRSLPGEKIDLGYNSLNQLISVNYPDSSPDLTYSYDAGGNLETLVSTDASWTYVHDAVNQLTAETLVTGSETFRSSYEFDTQDRLKKITYPSGLVVSVVPNAYGEPESIGSYATAIDYHENGSIASLSYGTQQGSGRVYTTTRNARQLPDNLRVKLGAATIADLTHSYDASANITAITDAVNGTGYNRQMGYDDIDRLETASGFWGSGSYSYDALGNLLTRTEGGQAMSYSYNTSLNRLTGITGANPYSFSYDSYGNVTNNGSQGFTYNRAGNMTTSTSPAISYKYDGHRRRVQKTEGGQTSYTVYGRSGKLLHKNAGGVETDYIYAGSMLIAEKQGSTIHYLHTDLLGSPIAGDNGPAYTEHYRPWGEKKNHPVQLSNDVGYTGHQDDVATGLTYMQARYYDPVVGRFYAVDPVGFDGSNLEHYGRFAYAYNNPFAYVDLDGREGKGFFEAIADNTRVKFGLSVGLNLKVSTPGLGFEAGIGEFASIAGSTSLSGQDQMEVSSSGPHLGGHIAGHPIGYQERVTTAISDTDDVTGVEKFREESSDGMFTETKTGDEQTRFEATSKTLLFEWKGAVKFSVEFDYFGYKDDRIEEQE